MCDIAEDRVKLMQKLVVDGRAEGADRIRPRFPGFRADVREQELDLVYNATPWEWHVPVCLAAMRAGKHAATEVPVAIP